MSHVIDAVHNRQERLLLSFISFLELMGDTDSCSCSLGRCNLNYLLPRPFEGRVEEEKGPWYILTAHALLIIQSLGDR